jgi:hypothetical protein
MNLAMTLKARNNSSVAGIQRIDPFRIRVDHETSRRIYVPPKCYNSHNPRDTLKPR